jgi:hypothetical protein
MQFLSNIATFALLTHLLIATSGLPFAYHFCSGELISVSLGEAVPACECHPDEATDDANSCCDKDCCQYEVTVSKLDFDGVFLFSFLAHIGCGAPVEALTSFSLISTPKILSSSLALFEHFPPHRSSDIPVLFRSLLI